jgi:hypothetical protein
MFIHRLRYIGIFVWIILEQDMIYDTVHFFRQLGALIVQIPVYLLCGSC